MPMTALPPAPSRDTPSTFATLADAFVAALPTFVTEANTLETNVNAKEASATTAASNAAISEAAAEAAQAAAEAASNATKWISGTTYTEGTVVWSPIDYLSYRRKITGAGTIDPSLDLTNWQKLGLPVSPITNDVNFDFAQEVTFTTASNKYIDAVVELDTDRELIIVGGINGIHSLVYTRSTKTLSSATLIRSGAVYDAVKAVLVSTDKVLLVSTITGSAQAVILSISGTTVTVGTPSSFTGYFYNLDGDIYSGNNKIVLVGSTYILNIYDASANTGFVAMAVSGTTVTVGTPVHLSGYFYFSAIYALTSSTFLAISTSNSALHTVVYTISGVTLTAGTPATTTASLYSATTSGVLSSGRYAVMFNNSGMKGTVVSVSGTTVTIGTPVTLFSYSGTPEDHSMHIVGSQAICANGTVLNVLTDNSGTPVAGASVTPANSAGKIVGFKTSSVVCVANSMNAAYCEVAISGNNPIISYHQPQSSWDTNTTTVFDFTKLGYASELKTKTLKSTNSDFIGLSNTLLPFLVKIPYDNSRLSRVYSVGYTLGNSRKLQGSDKVLWNILETTTNKSMLSRYSVN